jgi:hypothetical protein
VWFKDEAPVGQQGTLTRIWAERGTRPRAPRDTRYKWAYIFGAVCPERGVTAALIMPHANTEAMNAHLLEISRAVAKGAHAALVLDGAGWHATKALEVPVNITLVLLPPYAPELNPIENVWAYPRSQIGGAARSVIDFLAVTLSRCIIYSPAPMMMAMPIRLRTLGKSWKTRYPNMVATGNSRYCNGANVAEGARERA